MLFSIDKSILDIGSLSVPVLMECHGQSHWHVSVRDGLHCVGVDDNEAVHSLVVIVDGVH
jgi:hypothetical protein